MFSVSPVCLAVREGSPATTGFMSAQFGILGPLEVTVDGDSIDLGPPRQRALLALFLTRANRVIATDRILEMHWGDESSGKENALWVYISRLRTMLEPDRTRRGESSFLLTEGNGYVLRVEPSCIDAVVFEQEVAEGRDLMATDPQSASEILARALDRWRGDALEEFTYEEFARSEIVRLEELRVGAVEDRIAADLLSGRARELIGELESLCEAHPFRERLVGHLTLALYRSGRQADALRAIERFRRRLGEEADTGADRRKAGDAGGTDAQAGGTGPAPGSSARGAGSCRCGGRQLRWIGRQPVQGSTALRGGRRLALLRA